MAEARNRWQTEVSGKTIEEIEKAALAAYIKFFGEENVNDHALAAMKFDIRPDVMDDVIGIIAIGYFATVKVEW
jgi:hypothetical protein